MLLHILTLLLPLVAGNYGRPEPNRKLLDGLEFSIVFPRNETYAPTQYFPLVMAVRNPVDVWPLGISMAMTIWPDNEQVPPFNSTYRFPPRGHYEESSPPVSSPFFFVIAGTDLINGTTGGFSLLWEFIIEYTCGEPTSRYDPGVRPYVSGSHHVRFSMAHSAPLPDIEAAVNRCPSSSVLLKPYGLREGIRDGDCPLVNLPDLDTQLPPVPDPCLVSPFAKELAANVSTSMLGLMGCPNGTWQTITQPCPPMETKKSRGLPNVSGLEVAWLLLIATSICMVL